MKPFIKWPGGKTEELKIILENIPKNMNRFFEPFVGGGAVYFAVDNINQYFINDKSKELISLYKSIQTQNNMFFYSIKEIDKCWKSLEKISENHIHELSNLYAQYKVDRIKDSELKTRIQQCILFNADELNGMLNDKFIMDEKRILLEFENNLFRKLKRMKKKKKKKKNKNWF